MRTLTEFLSVLADRPGADLNLIVGQVPALRVAGDSEPLESADVFTSEAFADLLADSGLKRGGDVAWVNEDGDRFRVTVFDIGEGLIARPIPSHIPSPFARA